MAPLVQPPPPRARTFDVPVEDAVDVEVPKAEEDLPAVLLQHRRVQRAKIAEDPETHRHTHLRTSKNTDNTHSHASTHTHTRTHTLAHACAHARTHAHKHNHHY